MGRLARLCIIIDEANHRDQHASAHPHLKPCKIDRPKCDEDHTILGSMHLMLEIVLGFDLVPHSSAIVTIQAGPDIPTD